MPIGTSSESESECAGSVETIKVFLPCSANHNAVAEDTEVFPTPPFQPMKINVVLSLLNLK